VLTPVLAMAVGLMTNNSTLTDYASKYFTAFIKAGIYDNGAVTDFRRWLDCSPPCPGSMWSHTAGAVNGLIAMADMYARAGNASLYALTAPTQVVGGSGGTVGLQTVLKLWAQMANKTTQLHGTTSASQVGSATLLSWDTLDLFSNQGEFYWDFGSMVANLYYNDSEIHTAMSRNLRSGNTNTSRSCYDPQFAGCFSGEWAHWADLPFMYGNMQGKVNPHGGTATGSIPLNPPLNLRVSSP
jgi:hypothetical protein